MRYEYVLYCVFFYVKLFLREANLVRGYIMLNSVGLHLATLVLYLSLH